VESEESEFQTCRCQTKNMSQPTKVNKLSFFQRCAGNGSDCNSCGFFNHCNYTPTCLCSLCYVEFEKRRELPANANEWGFRCTKRDESCCCSFHISLARIKQREVCCYRIKWVFSRLFFCVRLFLGENENCLLRR
jgi:hypothetical protein